MGRSEFSGNQIFVIVSCSLDQKTAKLHGTVKKLNIQQCEVCPSRFQVLSTNHLIYILCIDELLKFAYMKHKQDKIFMQVLLLFYVNNEQLICLHDAMQRESS